MASGGAIGCVARYGMDFLRWFDNNVYHTVAANLIGCLLIGIIFTVLAAYDASTVWSRFLITGLLGGFTTFSAFSLHPLLMIKNGLWLQASIYILVTVAGGLAACAIGMYATERLLEK